MKHTYPLSEPSTGWLNKGSGESWAACKASTPVASTDPDIGDYEYLLVGKTKSGKDPGPYTWGIYRSYLRFQAVSIPATHTVGQVYLRLYVADDRSDTDFTFAAKVLETGYGTLEPDDWTANGGPQSTQVTSGGTIKTDIGGRQYIDVVLDSATVAAIPETGTFDVLLYHTSDEGDAPTGDEFLRCYSQTCADTGLRPYVKVVTMDKREQILAALATRLGTITEVAGYETTPKTVSRIWQPLGQMGGEKFPVLLLYAQDEERNHLSFGSFDCTWRVVVHCAVYAEVKDDLETALNELCRDVSKAVESDYGTDSPLGIDTIMNLHVSAVRQSLGFLIDNNRAVAEVELTINYLHLTNQE